MGKLRPRYAILGAQDQLYKALTIACFVFLTDRAGGGSALAAQTAALLHAISLLLLVWHNPFATRRAFLVAITLRLCLLTCTLQLGVMAASVPHHIGGTCSGTASLQCSPALLNVLVIAGILLLALASRAPSVPWSDVSPSVPSSRQASAELPPSRSEDQ